MADKSGSNQVQEQARRLLAAGDAEGACALLERLIESSPPQVNLYLMLAAALRALRRWTDELQVLEQALRLDPTHPIVLLQKGAVLELVNKPRSAAEAYSNALQALPPKAELPPAVQAHVAHARERVAVNAAAIGALIGARLQAMSDFDPTSADCVRFSRALDRVLGRRRIYLPEPTFLLFPYLVNDEFHPRSAFPWLATLEAATDVIRKELLEVLAAHQTELQPYIEYADGLPLNQWKELNRSRRWSAYFLWNAGLEFVDHVVQCPRTMEILRGLPQVDIPGHGPTLFFSILEPHTTIPAHTGVTNARLTVHLPLIVPPGCRFRVGGTVREWKVGEAWVFDDTIEHEAWNDSDSPRAILIFDVWNPQLTERERTWVREALTVLGEYNGAEKSRRKLS